jgi:hypothetical protein
VYPFYNSRARHAIRDAVNKHSLIEPRQKASNLILKVHPLCRQSALRLEIELRLRPCRAENPGFRLSLFNFGI